MLPSHDIEYLNAKAPGHARGTELYYSVTGYLEAYEEHAKALRKSPQDPVALLMLDGFDPRTVNKFQGIRDRVRTFAEDTRALAQHQMARKG